MQVLLNIWQPCRSAGFAEYLAAPVEDANVAQPLAGISQVEAHQLAGLLSIVAIPGTIPGLPLKIIVRPQ